jgi:hypothetical protein
MTETSRGPLNTVLHIVGRVAAAIVVVIWTLLDGLLFPLFRPLVRWLSALRLFEVIGAWLGRLPPYVVLVCLAVPFVLIEPLKVVALYLMASGLVIRGTVLLIFAHALSILTLDRIYHAGHGQLMKIGWFARLMGWVIGLRDWVFLRVKETATWQAAWRIVVASRSWVARLFRPA